MQWARKDKSKMLGMWNTNKGYSKSKEPRKRYQDNRKSDGGKPKHDRRFGDYKRKNFSHRFGESKKKDDDVKNKSESRKRKGYGRKNINEMGNDEIEENIQDKECLKDKDYNCVPISTMPLSVHNCYDTTSPCKDFTHKAFVL